jgi:hypothetical protein
MTYNEDERDHVPATIDEVHLPGDVLESDGDTVYKDNAVRFWR